MQANPQGPRGGTARFSLTLFLLLAAVAAAADDARGRNPWQAGTAPPQAASPATASAPVPESPAVTGSAPSPTAPAAPPTAASAPPPGTGSLPLRLYEGFGPAGPPAIPEYARALALDVEAEFTNCANGTRVVTAIRYGGRRYPLTTRCPGETAPGASTTAPLRCDARAWTCGPRP